MSQGVEWLVDHVHEPIINAIADRTGIEDIRVYGIAAAEAGKSVARSTDVIRGLADAGRKGVADFSANRASGDNVLASATYSIVDNTPIVNIPSTVVKVVTGREWQGTTKGEKLSTLERTTMGFSVVGQSLLLAADPASAPEADVEGATNTPAAEQTNLGCFREGTPVLSARGLEPIERIAIGRRIAAESDRCERAFSINPDGYRILRLVFVKDGQEIRMAFLRPAKLAEGLCHGDNVDIAVLELQVRGSARVVAIEPCPTIESGPGWVVTGCFSSFSVDVWQLKLAGLQTPLEVTGNHPIFSEDGHDFISASMLRPGERLRTLDGTATVEFIAKKPGRWEVFNLEIHSAHQYLCLWNKCSCSQCGAKRREWRSDAPNDREPYTNADRSSYSRATRPSLVDRHEHIF